MMFRHRSHSAPRLIHFLLIAWSIFATCYSQIVNPNIPPRLYYGESADLIIDVFFGPKFFGWYVDVNSVQVEGLTPQDTWDMGPLSGIRVPQEIHPLLGTRPSTQRTLGRLVAGYSSASHIVRIRYLVQFPFSTSNPGKRWEQVVNVEIVEAPANFPRILEQPKSLEVVAGSNAVFSIRASGGPPLAFQWRKDGNAMPNGFMETLIITNVSKNDEGQYNCTVSNSEIGRNISSASCSLTVLEKTTVAIQRPTAIPFHEGDSVRLIADAKGANPLTYQWYKNKSEITGEQSQSLLLTNVSLLNSGLYTILASGPGGVASDVVNVEILPRPQDPYFERPIRINRLQNKAILSWKWIPTNSLSGLVLERSGIIAGSQWEEFIGPVFSEGSVIVNLENDSLYRLRLGASNTNNASTFGMVKVPSGTFLMGDTLDSIPDAQPVQTSVSSLMIDSTLVTWNQWTNIYAWATNHGYEFRNAGIGKSPDHPVAEVNWFDCVKWCNARSERLGLQPVYYTDKTLTNVFRSGQFSPLLFPTPDFVYPKWSANGYRLPTEAEWEYCARGGISQARFPNGMTLSTAEANFVLTQTYRIGPRPWTNPVGVYAPNGYGLYDMAGNLNQWCWNVYSSTLVGGSDPRSDIPGGIRVTRGGSYKSLFQYCRVANRQMTSMSFAYQDVGFRTVKSP